MLMIAHNAAGQCERQRYRMVGDFAKGKSGLPKSNVRLG
jgi:hypothetical protein